MTGNTMDVSYFRHFLETVEALPTLPTIALKGIKLSLSPNISKPKLLKLIQLDPPLAATLLKIINNPSSNKEAKTTSLDQALSAVDPSLLRSHLLSVPALEHFSDQKRDYGFLLTDFWKHSIHTAVWARELAKFQKIFIDPEEAFVAGLIHDIGKLIIIDQLNESYHEVLALAKEKDISLFKAEQEHFGFDHGAVGQWLLEHWNVPELYRNAVCYHHFPTRELLKKEKHFYLCQLINLADQFSYSQNAETQKKLNYKKFPFAQLKEVSGAADSLEHLNESVQAETTKLFEEIDWKPLSTSTYLPVVNEANIALRNLYLNQKKHERTLILRERELQGLNVLGRELLNTHSFQKALRRFTKMLVTAFPFNRAIAAIYLDDEWELISQAQKSGSSQQCQPVLAAQRRRLEASPSSINDNDQSESWLFIDLIGKSKPLGYLNVSPDEDQDNFTNKIGLLLASCADIFSEVVEKIQNHQKNQKRAESLKDSVVEINEEKALAEHEKIQRDNLIWSFPLGITLLDEKGNIKYYNSMMEQLFSTIGSCLNKPFMTLFPDPLLNNGIENVLAGEKIFRGTTTISDSEPTSEKIYQWSLTPVSNKHETRTSLLLLIDDKTDEQTVQKMLLESARMTSVGELASGTAHNLRNPLGAAKGILELLLEDIEEKGTSLKTEEADEPQFTDSIKEQLQIVLQSLEKCFIIIDDLVHFAREPDRPPRKLNLNELLSGTESLLSELFKERDIQIIKELEIDEIFGNQADLTQVFLNLYSNAYKAMSQGGTLTIQSRLISLGDKHQLVKISISDTGCGIPTESLSKIFDPFYTTSERLEGTGLGLSLTQKIIKEHGGILEVTSVVGKGTTFHVTLPVHPEIISKKGEESKFKEEYDGQ